jgi:hypothetical protein
MAERIEMSSRFKLPGSMSFMVEGLVWNLVE